MGKSVVIKGQIPVNDGSFSKDDLVSLFDTSRKKEQAQAKKAHFELADFHRAEIIGRSLYRRHCGQRTYRARLYYSHTDCWNGLKIYKNSNPVHICGMCGVVVVFESPYAGMM